MSFIPGATGTPSTATDGLIGKGILANVETISATKTLTNSDRRVQVLTPSGADRTVVLPTSSIGAGESFTISNPATATFNLVVQSSNLAEVIRLSPGRSVELASSIATPTTPSDWNKIASASASGGAGELNAILNSSGADGTTGWTGVSVVSGASSPLNPVVTTAFSISNSATTESSTSGGYYPFTMPSGLLNRKLKVEFTFSTPATDVYRVSVYRGTTRVPLSTDSSSVTTLPANVTGGKYVGYFDTDSSTSWTLSVTRTSGTTGACVITNVIVGPGIQPQGAVVGEWISYTPTGSWTTNTTYVGRYRRVGDSIELQVNIQLSGAPGGTSQLGVNLPAGLSIDATKIAGTNRTGSNVQVEIYRNGQYGLGFGEYVASVAESLKYRFFVQDPAGSGNSTVVLTQTAPTSWANNDFINIDAKVPIAEWAGSGTVQLAQNDVEYAFNTSGITAAGATNTTSFGYGPQGAVIGSINSTTAGSDTVMRVRFTTPVQASDFIVLEVDQGTGGTQWVEASNTGIAAGLFQSSSSYGMYFRTFGTTDVDVRFGNKGIVSSGATYGSDGLAWSAISAWRWRVRKSSAGAAVGFGIVVPGTSAGLVSATGLPARTSATAISAGFVGQTIQHVLTTASGLPGASNAFGDARSITTLTPGVWRIDASVEIDRNGATFSATDFEVGVSTTSGNSGTDLTSSVNFARVVNAVPTTFSWYTITIPSFIVGFDGTTFTKLEEGASFAAGSTLYLKLLVASFTGSPLYRAKLTATRM